MNAPLPDHIRKALEKASLDDKYTLSEGRAFMSGVQALVRLPLLQRVVQQRSATLVHHRKEWVIHRWLHNDCFPRFAECQNRSA